MSVDQAAYVGRLFRDLLGHVSSVIPQKDERRALEAKIETDIERVYDAVVVSEYIFSLGKKSEIIKRFQKLLRQGIIIVVLHENDEPSIPLEGHPQLVTRKLDPHGPVELVALLSRQGLRLHRVLRITAEDDPFFLLLGNLSMSLPIVVEEVEDELTQISADWMLALG